ncbi:transposase [uncultured Alphaproteobacteria bacterium]|uniref:Transposase n=1 Tax=uncultured Alphaproteobacteria bacterium TaxID=91750 RepID=A0A212KJS6_9PROT|nr:transposase [uncultured Alphaproteobacteria bacterium]
MMREWYTAAELAEMNLPGLPTTKRGIHMMAQGSWKSRPRKGRGGGVEYHLSSLPATVQAKLIVRSTAVEKADNPECRTDDAARAARWAHYDSLPDNRKAKAKEKLATLQEVETLRLGGMPVDIAAQQVAALRGVGLSTIHSWRKKVAGVPKADWLPYLADQYTGRTATEECSPDAWEMIKGDYLRPEQPNFSQCYRNLMRAAKANGWSVPSERTLLRRLSSSVHPMVVVLRRKGQDAALRMYPALERDRSVFRAMEAVNTDGHVWDVRVEWPDGEIGRPCMVGFQDLYSGKLLSWRVDRSENTWAVRLAFGDMVEQYGIPEHCYFDNGRSFASKWLTGGVPNRYRFKVKEEEPVGIVTQMGVQVHWTTPYHGQSKPIERYWRDLAQNVARHPAFAGAWTGNTVANKPSNYGSKAIPIDKFLDVVASEIAEHNARAGRDTRVCRKVLSFDDAFEGSRKQSPVTRCSDEQRRLWMLAAEGIHVSRTDGVVKLMDNRYWAEWLHLHLGEKVVARFDPDFLWDGLEIYRLDGVYLGHADCLAPAGYNDAEAARTQSRARRQWLRGVKMQAEAEVRMSPDAVAALIPPHSPTPAPTGTVVALPRPVHDLRRTPVQTLTPAQEARREAMVHEFPSPAAPASVADEKRQRFARAQAAEAQLAAGGTLSDAEARWLAAYQKLPEYRALAAVAAEFGGAEIA